ncbi:uncharacterized protein BT62DRAFT_229206 [Guyanagaster necrorhizus]|uniref:Uncharacterized protein n=1 Tax=Guyanagaster necrorhizus TaxID=856835 RepID=A0A9P7VQY2_9AGAR|nr:uncharacterized protein BT62DRAFT_229206 [Guyanagaster necrorhizus MCA 3950]KAG7444825.1 hypothetical protein BT62DRAFT_229206 [Guyanagaster necrorhizus MCA 3950]
MPEYVIAIALLCLFKERGLSPVVTLLYYWSHFTNRDWKGYNIKTKLGKTLPDKYKVAASYNKVLPSVFNSSSTIFVAE